MSRARRIARDLLFIAVVIAGIRFFQTRDMPSGQAPPLVGQDLAGATVSLADLRGEPVVVYFWASWCGVCKAIDGNVASLAEGARVVRVAVHSGQAENIRGALDARALGAQTVLVDARGALASSWGVDAFPTLFFLDEGGKIRFTEVGYTSTLGMKARSFLSGLF